MEFLQENGGNGSKISFGRLAALLVIIFGLSIVTASVIMDYTIPTNAVTFAEPYITPTGMVEAINTTVLVPQTDWEGKTNFLQWGVAPLAFLMYGGGKMIGVAKEWTNGKKKHD